MACGMRLPDLFFRAVVKKASRKSGISKNTFRYSIQRSKALREENLAEDGSGGLSANRSIMALLKIGGAPIFWTKAKMCSICQEVMMVGRGYIGE